jgi:hypothetical protein
MSGLFVLFLYGESLNLGLTARPGVATMGVWQGVAMDSLKYHMGPPWPTLLHPTVRPPLGWPAHRVVGLRPYYSLFGHPTPNAYVLRRCKFLTRKRKKETVEHLCYGIPIQDSTLCKHLQTNVA